MVVESRVVFIKGTCGGFVTTYDSILIYDISSSCDQFNCSLDYLAGQSSV